MRNQEGQGLGPLARLLAWITRTDCADCRVERTRLSCFLAECDRCWWGRFA